MATTWKPDTCECEIVVHNWDAGTHAFNKRCPAHAEFEDVLAENQCKNEAVSAVLDNAPSLAGDHTKVKWFFDDERSLVVDLDDVPERMDVVNGLRKFGPKVKVKSH